MAKKQQPQLPAWVWLFTGVVTGLFAAFLVYLANVKGAPTMSAANKPRPAYNTPTASTNGSHPSRMSPPQESPRFPATEPPAAGEKERKFEFYTLLPEAETLGGPPDAEESAAKPVTAANAKTEAKKPETPKQRIILQTGSFQRTQDAEKLRAQLILLGLPASIQKVDIRPGETWFRVQAGPFTDTASVARAQKTLGDARIQHIVIRMKNS